MGKGGEAGPGPGALAQQQLQSVPAVPSNSCYADDPKVRLPVCRMHIAAVPSCSGHQHTLFLQVWDLVVVGAGIAGSALAYSQAKVGQSLCWSWEHSPHLGCCLPGALLQVIMRRNWRGHACMLHTAGAGSKLEFLEVV